MTNISEQIAELRELIEKSEKILITSHISPDPDSICSILLLGTTLRENYPDKIIVTSSEELLGDLDFLAGYDRIQQMPLIEVVAGADLVIMVDAMNFERASRKDALGVRKFIQQKSVPFIIIDHHEPNGVDDNQVYINESYPSCVQQVYKTLFEDLKLTKPDGYANTTMVGLYSDTGGFTYIQRKPKETLKLIGELIDQGVDVQQVRTQLSRYSMDQIRVLKELLNNISSEDDYTYSYLSDEIIDEWNTQNKQVADLGGGISLFTSQYVRNIDGRGWGYVVYKNPLLEDGWYSVSLRSISGLVDVAEIAQRLDGGGHKPAAGGKLKAANVREAIEKVKQAINQARSS